jgi:alkylation response protein AidB-like acyl-CoA dehydrogenase
MSPEQFKQRLVAICDEQLPLPGKGATAQRHRRLMEVGREDLSVARLAEAHWDAVAILAEAGHAPVPGGLYGVWASEIPGKALSMESGNGAHRIEGTKMFCSGAGLVDRALVTVGLPEQRLVDVDLRNRFGNILIDGTAWKTDAFRLTQTSAVTFDAVEVSADSILGGVGWYLHRPGFWHGACGPAACWAGGAAGLLDHAMLNKRDDAHTLAHLAAMNADVWGLESYLELAGREIDMVPSDLQAAEIRALRVRHLVEQACTDVIRRFARAYGPAPLSMDIEALRRYHEADLYLRQSHAERDLESLARRLKDPRT